VTHLTSSGEETLLGEITSTVSRNGVRSYELFNYTVKVNYVELTRQGGQICKLLGICKLIFHVEDY